MRTQFCGFYCPSPPARKMTSLRIPWKTLKIEGVWGFRLKLVMRYGVIRPFQCIIVIWGLVRKHCFFLVFLSDRECSRHSHTSHPPTHICEWAIWTWPGIKTNQTWSQRPWLRHERVKHVFSLIALAKSNINWWAISSFIGMAFWVHWAFWMVI